MLGLKLNKGAPDEQWSIQAHVTTIADLPSLTNGYITDIVTQNQYVFHDLVILLLDRFWNMFTSLYGECHQKSMSRNLILSQLHNVSN